MIPFSDNAKTGKTTVSRCLSFATVNDRLYYSALYPSMTDSHNNLKSACSLIPDDIVTHLEPGDIICYNNQYFWADDFISFIVNHQTEMFGSTKASISSFGVDLPTRFPSKIKRVTLREGTDIVAQFLAFPYSLLLPGNDYHTEGLPYIMIGESRSPLIESYQNMDLFSAPDSDTGRDSHTDIGAPAKKSLDDVSNHNMYRRKLKNLFQNPITQLLSMDSVWIDSITPIIMSSAGAAIAGGLGSLVAKALAMSNRGTAFGIHTPTIKDEKKDPFKTMAVEGYAGGELFVTKLEGHYSYLDDVTYSRRYLQDGTVNPDRDKRYYVLNRNNKTLYGGSWKCEFKKIGDMTSATLTPLTDKDRKSAVVPGTENSSTSSKSDVLNFNFYKIL